MPAKPPPLAKLSRPALHRAVPRERLYALLDGHRAERRAMCIVGPPGAGKTTLLASWLNARRIRGVWYQVDPGDADLSTFFYYLSQAAEPYRRRGQRGLPLLLPEYLGDVQGFARRFFREFYARLPAGAVVAFDNYQEVPPDATFHEVVAIAVEEAPPGIVLAVVSRRDPPACYARLLANENVGLVDWEALKLDREEVVALASRRPGLTSDRIERLHAATGGWAAGLVLALESGAQAVGSEDVTERTRDATFDYFAAEIYARVAPSIRRFLVATALLPDVPLSVARELTGEPAAQAILEDLYARHFFTHRKPGSEPTFWYHALFREFLLRQGQRQLSGQELGELRRRAARLIETQYPDAALELFAQAGAHADMERLIVRGAPALMAQGRQRLLVDRIRVVPTKQVATSPWLSCWLGIALTSADPIKARAHLEHAFDLADRCADAQCMVSSAAGVIQTYLLEYNAFRPLDEWAEKLLHAIGRVRFSSADAEVMAHAALVTAFGFRQPARAELSVSAQRVLELLPDVADINLRLSAAVSVLAWGSLAGPIEMAHRALPAAVALWRHVDVTPLNAAVAGHLIAWYHCYLGNRTECERALGVLEEIRNEHDLPAAAAYAATIGAWLDIYQGRVDCAMRWLDVLVQTADLRRPFDRAMLDGIKGWISMVRGETSIALEHNSRGVAIYDELGSLPHQILFRQHLIWNNIELGDFDAARRHIADSRRLIEGFGVNRFELDLLIAEANMALRDGELSVCRERLRAALGLSRAHGMDYGWNALHWWMSPLCAVALEAGIEREHVRHLIRRNRWRVPPTRPEQWPWRVKIFTFGCFQVLLDEQLLTFGHKTPRKPIALLKLIVATGGSDVPATGLMDALWPELDGDSAYHSFVLTLHRLRRLLGHPEAVLLNQSKVSLNADLVWVDACAFTHALSRMPRNAHLIEVLLNLYRGAFLPDSDDYAELIGARERFRRQFVDCLDRTARLDSGKGDARRACGWYQRALEVEPLAEELVQGLVRCWGRAEKDSETDPRLLRR